MENSLGRKGREGGSGGWLGVFLNSPGLGGGAPRSSVQGRFYSPDSVICSLAVAGV